MWRKVMARPPKLRSDLEAEASRADSTIRPPPPRAVEGADLELEDDAATTVLPLRWPEPPKDLAERLNGIHTDGVGLSRSVGDSARPRWSWLWRSLGFAVIVGAMLRVVPLRNIQRAARPAARGLEPAAAMVARPAPTPAPPPPAPLVIVVPSARPPMIKGIDVTSLPIAAPSSAAPRPAPKRVARPVVRAPVPAPHPPAAESSIDEDAYDAIPGPKGPKNENPY
jgi:hypothetical protein